MLDRKELIDLIEELKNFSGTERKEEKLLGKLESLVLDPEISDYIILDWYEFRRNNR